MYPKYAIKIQGDALACIRKYRHHHTSDQPDSRYCHIPRRYSHFKKGLHATQLHCYTPPWLLIFWTRRATTPASCVHHAVLAAWAARRSRARTQAPWRSAGVHLASQRVPHSTPASVRRVPGLCRIGRSPECADATAGYRNVLVALRLARADNGLRGRGPRLSVPRPTSASLISTCTDQASDIAETRFLPCDVLCLCSHGSPFPN